MAGCRSSSAGNAQLASRHHTAVFKSLSKRRHDDDASMAPARGAPEVTLQEGAALGSAMARKAAGKPHEEILLDWKR